VEVGKPSAFQEETEFFLIKVFSPTDAHLVLKQFIFALKLILKGSHPASCTMATGSFPRVEAAMVWG